MTISAADAEKLRQEWVGDKCDHPEKLLRVYSNSVFTGDFVCPICGKISEMSDCESKKVLKKR